MGEWVNKSKENLGQAEQGSDNRTSRVRKENGSREGKQWTVAKH